MSQLKKAARSIFIIIVFAFGSKILGFIREALIADKFGSGVETDTFFIAIVAISLFTKILIQAIHTTMIPVLSQVEKNEGVSGKEYHTNNLITLVIAVSLVMVIIGWLTAPIIIRFVAYGFEGEQFEFAVLMMRIGLPAIVFAGTVGVLRGYLQSSLRFTESAVSDFPYNLVYIFFLLLFSSILGIKGLILTSVFAVASQILVQIPSLRKLGYRYKPFIDIKDSYVKKMLYLLSPVLFSVGVNDLNKIVDKSLASTLINGSISALNYGNRLKSLVLDIFVTAIATVLFPVLSNEANKDNYDGLRRVMGYGINIVFIITIPATVGMIVLADPIVRIAFERGAFDSTATYMTTGALIFYSLGLMGMAQRTFLYRVYYSLQDTKTPMINGFISVALNIILNFVLIRYMAHRGLALATSISATIAAGLLLYSLKKKIGYLGSVNFIKCGLKSLFSSTVMGLVVYLLYYNPGKELLGSTIAELFMLFFSSAVGALVYLIIIYILKVEELNWLINVIKKKIQSHKI